MRKSFWSPQLMYLRIGVSLTFIFILLASVLFPIYSDEYYWKLINSRLFLDDFKQVFYYPFCSKNYILDTPFTWYIPRTLEALLYQNAQSFLKLRILGIVTFIFNVLLFGNLIYILHRDILFKRENALFVSILSLTTTFIVFVLLMNRPEQTIFFWILLILNLFYFIQSLKAKQRAVGLGMKITIFLVQCFAIMSLFSMHPKSLYFLPFLAFINFQIFKRDRILLFLVSLLLLVSAIETYDIWSKRLVCDESPSVTGVHTNYNLRLSAVFSNPRQILKSLAENISRSYLYLDHAKYQEHYQNDWLPSIKVENKIFSILNLAPYSFVILWIILITFLLLKITWHQNLNLISNETVLGILLSFQMISVILIQQTTHFYQIGLLWPLLLLSIVFCFHPLKTFKKFQGLATKIIKVILFVNAVNLVVIAMIVVSTFLGPWKANRTQRTVDITEIKDLAQKCKVDIQNEYQKLILDFDTYGQFYASKNPVIWMFLYGPIIPEINARESIKASQRTNAILQCKHLPNFSPKSLEKSTTGKFCCAEF